MNLKNGIGRSTSVEIKSLKEVIFVSNEVIEGLRQSARTIIIAIAPVLVAQLQSDQIDWKAIGIAVTIALLSGLNTWAHEKDIKPYKALGIKDAGLSPI